MECCIMAVLRLFTISIWFYFALNIIILSGHIFTQIWDEKLGKDYLGGFQIYGFWSEFCYWHFKIPQGLWTIENIFAYEKISSRKILILLLSTLFEKAIRYEMSILNESKGHSSTTSLKPAVILTCIFAGWLSIGCWIHQVCQWTIVYPSGAEPQRWWIKETTPLTFPIFESDHCRNLPSKKFEFKWSFIA